MRKQAISALLTVICMMLAVSEMSAQKPRTSVSGPEVTGTFKMHFIGAKYKGMTNELEILALGGGRLKIAFDLIYPFTMNDGEVSVNMGSLSGEASIIGDKAVYESDEFGPCKITITFVRQGTVKVRQDGTDVDCGFGHNVSAEGTYRKVSNRKPKFEDLL